MNERGVRVRVNALREELALTLFVFFDGATNNHHFAMTANDATIDAARFNRSANLHSVSVIFGRLGKRRKNANPLFRQRVRVFVRALFVAVKNAATRQIVDVKFDQHAVAGQNFDEVATHPARHVCQNLVPRFQFHAKSRVGQSFHHATFDFYSRIFCHIYEICVLCLLAQRLPFSRKNLGDAPRG